MYRYTLRYPSARGVWSHASAPLPWQPPWCPPRWRPWKPYPLGSTLIPSLHTLIVIKTITVDAKTKATMYTDHRDHRPLILTIVVNCMHRGQTILISATKPMWTTPWLSSEHTLAIATMSIHMYNIHIRTGRKDPEQPVVDHVLFNYHNVVPALRPPAVIALDWPKNPFISSEMRGHA